MEDILKEGGELALKIKSLVEEYNKKAAPNNYMFMIGSINYIIESPKQKWKDTLDNTVKMDYDRLIMGVVKYDRLGFLKIF